jgi:hypothetical protein
MRNHVVSSVFVTKIILIDEEKLKIDFTMAIAITVDCDKNTNHIIVTM